MKINNDCMSYNNAPDNIKVKLISDIQNIKLDCRYYSSLYYRLPYYRSIELKNIIHI